MRRSLCGVDVRFLVGSAGEEVQDVTDGQSGLCRVPQRYVEVDGVLVAVADSALHADRSPFLPGAGDVLAVPFPAASARCGVPESVGSARSGQVSPDGTGWEAVVAGSPSVETAGVGRGVVAGSAARWTM